MLLRISSIITPDIYEIIYRMGHKDEIAIVDANYKGVVMGERRIYSSLTKNDELLEELLKYFPLDSEGSSPPTAMMELDDQYHVEPLMWSVYAKIVQDYDEGRGISKIAREQFYERTRSAYATIQTSDSRLHGNILLRKGIVLSDYARTNE
jgi:Fucose dissimilation pathway protein FucU